MSESPYIPSPSGGEGPVEIQVWRRPVGWSISTAVDFAARLHALLEKFDVENITSQTGPGDMPVSRQLQALTTARERTERHA